MAHEARVSPEGDMHGSENVAEPKTDGEVHTETEEKPKTKEEKERDETARLIDEILDEGSKDLTPEAWKKIMSYFEEKQELGEDIHKSTAYKVARIVHKPSLRLENIYRVVLAVVLHGLMFVGLLVLFLYLWKLDVSQSSDWLEVTFQESKTLKLELMGCAVEVVTSHPDVPDSSGIYFKDTTARAPFSGAGASDVAVYICGNHTRAVCAGPAAAAGRRATAVLVLPPAQGAGLARAAVRALGEGRSALRARGGAHLGPSLRLEGYEMIAHLWDSSFGEASIAVKHGLLDFRNLTYTNNMTLVTEDTAIYYHSENPTMVQFEDDISGSDTCLSSSHGKPTFNHTSTGNGLVRLGITESTSSSQIQYLSVSRTGSTPGQAHFSYRVNVEERSLTNTLDNTDGVFSIDSGYGDFISDSVSAGYELIRMQVHGPGLESDLVDGYTEWVWSKYGRAHLWGAPPLYWALSGGLFAPAAARAEVVLPRAYCLSPAALSADADAHTCPGYVSYGTTTSDKIYETLWGAFPDDYKENTTDSSLVKLRADTAYAGRSWGFLEGLDAWRFSALEMGELTLFDIDSVLGVASSFLAARGDVYRTQDKAFVAMAWIVILLLPLISLTVMKGYANKTKRRYLKKHGATYFGKQWKENIRLCVRSVTYLFFVEVAIVRKAPRADQADGLIATTYAVFLHVLTIFVLVFPGLMISLLFMAVDVDQCCCFWSDMVSGSCAPLKRALPFSIVVIVLVCYAIMLLESFLHYLSKFEFHGSKFGLSCRKVLAWSSWRALRTLAYTATAMIVLAWASGFTIWVGLGALVAPHEFVPVLLGVVACVVATRAAYTQAQKLRARLRALALEAARRSGKGARDLEDVLEEAGYGEFQVWLLTTGTFIACVAATTFIILGMFLFVKTGNLGTTIMSSLMLLASTAAIVRSQKTDSAAAQNSLLTSKYSQRLGAATNAAAAVDKEYVDPLHVLVPPSVTAEDCEKEGGESKGGKDGEEAAAGGGAEAV